MTRLTVDGADRHSDLPPLTPLAEALRHSGHHAVKIGCNEGTCGACTVQLDGVTVAACLVPLARAAGRSVRTAAAIARHPDGHALVQHLAARGALQCGYCVPGIVASASARPGAPAAAVLEGHLCRCTGYVGLATAIDRARSGQRPGPPRVDGVAKASAAARYAADAVPRGHLHGVLVQCVSPHVMVRLEPGSAMEVEGAVAVLGPQDAPPGRYSANPHVVDDTLAPLESAVFNGEGRFVGDVVGVVVAETAHAARAMAARVVQIETPLPAVLDAAAASVAGAAPVSAGEPSNVRYRHGAGDGKDAVDAALSSSDHVVQGRYEVEPGPVGAIETIAAAARWDGDACTVWSTTQTAQVVADRMARLLGIEAGRIHVEPVAIGGGFGLKEEVFLEHLAAVASRACGGRTVLIAPTRAQMDRLRSRHRVRIDVTSGCDAQGRLLGRRAAITLDAGAEVSHSALICHHMVNVARQLYPTAPADIDGRVVVTNTTTAGSFRGYGTAELAFALESHLDDLAVAAAVDLLQIRRRNILRAGDRDTAEGLTVTSFASMACLDAIAARGWGVPMQSTDRWRRGRGLAMFAIVSATSTASHADTSQAACRLDADGTVVVETGVAEMGTGNHTAFAEVAAERVGVPLAAVRVEHVGSDRAPDDEGTFATRSVYVSSSALAFAADRLRSAILERASAITGIPAVGLDLDGGDVTCGEAMLPLGRCAPLRTTAKYAAPDTGLVCGAQMVEVAVDAWTGRVIVERVVSVHDVGRVLDMDLATGQVQGGVVQAIGIALGERFTHDGGHPVSRTLLEQQLPRVADVPPVIEAVFVADDGVRGPLGAKGLGEAPVVGLATAIGNAIRDATGVRLTTLPFSPESLWQAMR